MELYTKDGYEILKIVDDGDGCEIYRLLNITITPRDSVKYEWKKMTFSSNKNSFDQYLHFHKYQTFSPSIDSYIDVIVNDIRRKEERKEERHKKSQENPDWSKKEVNTEIHKKSPWFYNSEYNYEERMKELNHRQYLVIDTIFKSSRKISGFEISKITRLPLDETYTLLLGLYSDGCIEKVENEHYKPILTQKGVELYAKLNKSLGIYHS